MAYTRFEDLFTVWSPVDFEPEWEEGQALLALNVAGAGSIDEAIRLGMIKIHKFSELERLRQSAPPSLGGCGSTGPDCLAQRLIHRIEDVRLEDFRVEADRRRIDSSAFSDGVHE